MAIRTPEPQPQQLDADSDVKKPEKYNSVIRIGTSFQVALPRFNPVKSDALKEAVKDERFWKPPEASVSDDDIEKFLEDAAAREFTRWQGLSMLYYHQYNFKTSRECMDEYDPFPKWDELDVSIFNQYLSDFDGDFSKMHKKIPGKSVQQLVAFFYSQEAKRPSRADVEKTAKLKPCRKRNSQPDEEKEEPETFEDSGPLPKKQRKKNKSPEGLHPGLEAYRISITELDDAERKLHEQKCFRTDPVFKAKTKIQHLKQECLLLLQKVEELDRPPVVYKKKDGVVYLQSNGVCSHKKSS